MTQCVSNSFAISHYLLKANAILSLIYMHYSGGTWTEVLLVCGYRNSQNFIEDKMNVISLILSHCFVGQRSEKDTQTEDENRVFFFQCKTLAEAGLWWVKGNSFSVLFVSLAGWSLDFSIIKTKKITWLFLLELSSNCDPAVHFQNYNQSTSNEIETVVPLNY